MFDKTEGVFVPMVSTLVAAGSQTTAHMSHPLMASTSDTSGLEKSYVQRQTSLREVMKRQTDTAAESIGLPVSRETQSMTAPKKKLVRPSSPRRV